jgi:DNA (cytosine-5)-methyltransferase 1
MAMVKKITDTSDKPKSEVKRIATYYDNFIFSGSYGEAWARIGNSVPPLFMRSIARHIREAIL